MPRYKNISNQPVHLEYDNTVINPGEEKEVYHFYDNSNLQLIDVKPYLSPFKISETNTTTNDNPKEYEILHYTTVITAYTDLEIHLNEDPSDKPIFIPGGSGIRFDNVKNQIYKIIIKPGPNVDEGSYYIAIYNPEYVAF